MLPKSSIRFTSSKACAAGTGIPWRILRLAKSKNAPGFNSNNTVNFELLKPWLDANMASLELELNTSTSLEDLKKENLTRDISLKDLEIQKRKRLYLEPDDVKSFLSSIAIAQSGVLKRIPKEYAPKCAGLSAGEIEQILEKATAEVFGILKGGLETWTKQ